MQHVANPLESSGIIISKRFNTLLMEPFQKGRRKISNKAHNSQGKNWSLLKTHEAQGKPPSHNSGHPLPKHTSGHPPPPHRGPGGGPLPQHTSHLDFRGQLAHPQPRCPQSTAQPLLSLLCAPAPCSTAVVGPRKLPFQQPPHNRDNSLPLHLQTPQTNSPTYSCHTPLRYIQSCSSSCWEPHRAAATAPTPLPG